MEFRRSGILPFGFSRSRTLATLGALAALVSWGCQADPEATAGHGLPDGGLQRDAQPASPDANAVRDAGLPIEDAARPADDMNPEADAAEPETDGAPLDDAASLPDGAPPPLPDAEVPPPTGNVRLALEVSNDVPESIFVQLGDTLGQPAWVRLEHENTQYFIRERCDYPQCGVIGEGICGAAQPMVRDITDGTAQGLQEMLWDGVVGHIEPGADCELREPAPAGAWKATFCWSLDARFDGEGLEGEARPGELLNPTCVSVPFELPGATEVVHHINGG